MAKRLTSVLTDDLETCLITGSTVDVERHHVFEGRQGFKEKSEMYGFIIPLRSDWHRTAPYAIHKDRKFSDAVKAKCQDYYEHHYGTHADWMREFGRNYL